MRVRHVTHHGAVPVLKREGRRRLTSAAETGLDFGSEIVQPRSSRSWASGASNQSIIDMIISFLQAFVE